jgi:anthraniloyl-CoA monooxygenase
MVLPPGVSDIESVERCQALLAEALQGHSLEANNSKWLNFVTVRNRTWRKGNLVLLGDAAHTAHFSIGSGTKLAMEDALALAASLVENPDINSALAAYEQERRPVVESTQRAAQASLEWFENIHQYAAQEPLQFAFNLLTRSRRVTYANLRLRDPEFMDRVNGWFAERQGAPTVSPPMFAPLRLRDLRLSNRVIVSPMDMYSSTDGLIGDFHMVHLGSKALGGAGLVMTRWSAYRPRAASLLVAPGFIDRSTRTPLRDLSNSSTARPQQRSVCSSDIRVAKGRPS